MREHHHIDPQLGVGGDTQSGDSVAAQFIGPDIVVHDQVGPAVLAEPVPGLGVVARRYAHGTGRIAPGCPVIRWGGQLGLRRGGQHMAGAGIELLHVPAVGDSGAAVGRDDLVRHSAPAYGNHTLLQLIDESQELCLRLPFGDLRALAVDVAMYPPADAHQDDGGG